MRIVPACLLAALAAAPLSAQSEFFEVLASFEPPAKPGAPGTVAVSFFPLDPDVTVNELPAPRLQLSADQSVLVEHAETVEPAEPMDPDNPRYLDLSEPVRFEVDWGPAPPPGIHGVAADLTYFYCSKSRGWCRRGTAEVTVPVEVKKK